MQFFTQVFNTKAKRIAAIVGSLIVLCAVIGFCAQGVASTSTPPSSGTTSTSTGQHQQAPAATDTPAPAKSWRTTQHFTGSDNKQTDTFTVQSDQWRIVWKSKVTGQYGGDFSMTLYQGDNTPVGLVANTSSSSGDTYTVHSGAGDYYLKMDVLFSTYDVSIQEYR